MSDLFSERELLFEGGPDEETADSGIEAWLLAGFGSSTVEERVMMAESLDRYDLVDQIRAQPQGQLAP